MKGQGMKLDIKRSLTPRAIREKAFAHHAKTGKQTVALTVLDLSLNDAEADALERFWAAHSERRRRSAKTA